MTARRVRFDSLADMLGFQLPRAAAVFKAAFEAELEPLGLRPSEATLLIYVGEAPGRTQSEIGRDLRVKPANMVPIVGGLVAAGLLQRTPREGRAIALSLTEAGGRRLEEVRQALQRQEDRITGHLAAADKALVIQVLRGIVFPDCRHD